MKIFVFLFPIFHCFDHLVLSLRGLGSFFRINSSGHCSLEWASSWNISRTQSFPSSSCPKHYRVNEAREKITPLAPDPHNSEPIISSEVRAFLDQRWILLLVLVMSSFGVYTNKTGDNSGSSLDFSLTKISVAQSPQTLNLNSFRGNLTQG